MDRTGRVSAGGWAGRISRWSRHAGFSIAETTIILAAASVLTATAAPSILDYVAQARGIKASGDVQVLTTALARLMFDVSSLKAGENGASPEMLVGPGDPSDPGGSGSSEWIAPVDGTKVQNLVDHLVTNTAGYSQKGPGPFAKGWGGPYVDGVPTDPWGRRYSANVGVFGTNTPVVVVSAGPNGIVETPFRGAGSQSAHDDVVGLIGSRR